MNFDAGKFLNNFNKASENIAQAKNAQQSKNTDGEKSISNNKEKDSLTFSKN